MFKSSNIGPAPLAGICLPLLYLPSFMRTLLIISRSSLVAQMVKCLSTTWETWVWSLGREDPLEKEMAIHSSTIAWKIPWTEEPGRLQSMGSQRVKHDLATSLSFSFIDYIIPAWIIQNNLSISRSAD